MCRRPRKIAWTPQFLRKTGVTKSLYLGGRKRPSAELLSSQATGIGGHRCDSVQCEHGDYEWRIYVINYDCGPFLGYGNRLHDLVLTSDRPPCLAWATNGVVNDLHTLPQASLGVWVGMNGWCEGLIGVSAFVSHRLQHFYLFNVTQTIGLIDEDAMCVLHILGFQVRIDHAGDMDDAGPFGEIFGFSGKEMMEGVMHNPELFPAIHCPDGFDGLPF